MWTQRARLAWLAVVALGAIWVALAGRVLVLPRRSGAAEALVVLSGDGRGERLIAAVGERRRQGWGRLVVLMKPGPVNDLKPQPAGYAASRDVPSQDFRSTNGGDSTAEEAGAVAALAKRCGWRRVRVVSSPYHLRRARWLFKRALRGRAQVVMTGSAEAFHPGRWWATRRDARVVLLEWAKGLYDGLRYFVSRPALHDPGMAC